MSQTVVVTGCAGFIGSNFIKQFKKEFPTSTIVGLDDFSTGRRDALDPSIIFYEGSILDEDLIDRIFSKHVPAYVFHFAALPRVSYSVEYPRRTSEVNIVGTIALLEASKNHNVKRFIYSSSSSVYGSSALLPTKESENIPNPLSPYAMQKYTGEGFCRIFGKLFGLETVCLRYFNVFGPGQYGDSPYATVMCAWLEALYFPQQNRNAFLEGDGSQSRDFCYVENVVAANILAMQSKNIFHGDAFNIAHGERTTINEARALIEEYTGKKLVLETHAARVGDVPHTHADVSKAKEILGYEQKMTFKDGLKQTIMWFESRSK